MRLKRPEDRREIENLVALANCEQVVHYISFFEDEDFTYLVLKLMKGNLKEFFDGYTIDAAEAIRLCKNVVMGLLHEQRILHRTVAHNCHGKI